MTEAWEEAEQELFLAAKPSPHGESCPRAIRRCKQQLISPFPPFPPVPHLNCSGFSLFPKCIVARRKWQAEP